MTVEASELLKKGLAAFRAGKLETAETLLQQAIARQPRAVGAHILLSNIARKRDDLPAAERHARQAIEVNPVDPAGHDALVTVQLASGESGTLVDACRRAAIERPEDFGAVYRLGVALLWTGKAAEAVKWLRRAQNILPGVFLVEFKIVRALFAAGRNKEVLEVVNGLLNRNVSIPALHDLAGKALLRLRQHEGAAKAFRQALEGDPEDYNHHAGLSTALFRAGRLEDAKEVTRNYLKRVNGFSLKAERPDARVLVLSGCSVPGCFTRLFRSEKDVFVNGNSLDRLTNARNSYHFTFIQHPDLMAAARALGPIDVVFNDISNAEFSIKMGRRAQIRAFADELGAPIVNPPEAIERTARANNARIIPEFTDIIYPRTILYDMQESGMKLLAARMLDEVGLPLLLRRTYSNKDTGVPLVKDEAALMEALETYRTQGADELYAIEYREQQFRPGIYRKIRCAIIDKVFYPVRVDFSNQWNVRREEKDSAVSLANQDLMDNELSFLKDPVAYLGEKNVERLEALGRLHDLDYLGVDFNILDNGDMFVFEANPSMNCIEDRRIRDFPYFKNYWRRVLVAYEDMFVRKAGEKNSGGLHK